MFQTDESGLLTGQTQYPVKGYGDVAVAPPAVPTGHVARWVSAVERAALEFGEPGTGEWTLLEDHRQDTLYTSDGQQYKIGDDHGGQTYDGLGPIPGWLSDVAPEPEPAPPYVLQQVTRAQGKAALIAAGLWSAVESFVDSIGDPTEKALALVALNDTTHWRRDSPFLIAAAAALGLTEQQLDDLFIQAATIEL